MWVFGHNLQNRVCSISCNTTPFLVAPQAFEPVQPINKMKNDVSCYYRAVNDKECSTRTKQKDCGDSDETNQSIRKHKLFIFT